MEAYATYCAGESIEQIVQAINRDLLGPARLLKDDERERLRLGVLRLLEAISWSSGGPGPRNGETLFFGDERGPDDLPNDHIWAALWTDTNPEIANERCYVIRVYLVIKWTEHLRSEPQNVGEVYLRWNEEVREKVREAISLLSVEDESGEAFRQVFNELRR